MLAGLSVEYYARMERGKLGGASGVSSKPSRASSSWERVRSSA